MVFARSMVAAAAMLASGPVLAQSYCRVPSFNYQRGTAVATTMRVVVATVPRPSVPGRAPQGWCNIPFRSMNPFYKPIQVVERPRLGQVASGSYSIRYRSNAVGSDAFAFKVFQSDMRTNQTTETQVTVSVEVVPAPF